MRTILALLTVGSLGLVTLACGGSVVSPLAQPADGGDAASQADSGMSTPPGDAGSPDTTTPPGDAGACAPPTDPTKAALCVVIAPEKIDFTSNPKFDGKGPLVAQVFSTATPDLPDGGTMTALGTVIYSGATGGAVDLSQPLPVTRFDDLPAGTVYARLIFEDDPASTSVAAGTWLGGYDLSGGLQTVTPIRPRAVPAGVGTTVDIDLVALRAMNVTLTRNVAPAGNGQGPATVIATPTAMPGPGAEIFGVAESPCANVAGSQPAQVDGFVFGKGPYYLAAVLDDFGPADAGITLPPGALTSLVETSGGVQIPASDELTYAPTAYSVSLTVPLDFLVSGDAGTDTVTCP